MTAETFIQEIYIYSHKIISALLNPVSYLSQQSATAVINNLPEVNLVPSFFSGALHSIAYIFTSIWNWLLFNILSPILVIIFIAIFIIAQIYLLKFYFFILKNIGGLILKSSSLIARIDIIKEIFSDFDIIIKNTKRNEEKSNQL